MKFKSGKYKGIDIEDVVKVDRSYLEYLFKLETLSPFLKIEISNALNIPQPKVEVVVMEALMARGWSKAESEQMINRIKVS